MPFRASFACLWCGRRYEAQGLDDLEGWAQLCPDCLGNAGEHRFLRDRLRRALAERARATPEGPRAAVPAGSTDAITADPLVAYYEARAPEYDDWYLRRGRYSQGPMSDLQWQAELDEATLWLDGLPIGGEIVELAAGTGWWSPLLAQKGELWIYDLAETALDRAHDRLLAHRLRAHIHVRDVWEEPDRQVDAVFCGFWLSHVPRARLQEFLALVRRWLKPDGSFAFVDSRPDPESGARDHPAPREDRSLRRLSDGREFEIPKVYYQPAELESALHDAGFTEVDVRSTSRFFLLGRATARPS
jgi:SAM-dependent methyltransferase